MLLEENKDNYTLMGNQERKANDAKAEMQMLLQSPEESEMWQAKLIWKWEKSGLEKNALKMFSEQL